MAPYGQSVSVKNANLVFSNGVKTRELPINSFWGIASQSEPTPSPQTFPTWHHLFPEGTPKIQPSEAFSTTLLYPDDESVIGELESQPFAMDYFDDLLDEDPRLKTHMASANHILISQCDAAVSSCLRLDRQRIFTILYTCPRLAQKQAQNLWNTLAQSQKLNWIDSIRFLPYSQHWQTCLKKAYDIVFHWVAFTHFQDHQRLGQTIHEINNLLPDGGIAFIVGPSLLAESTQRNHLELLYGEYVSALPTFRLHRSILPKTRIHPDLMVFVFRKNR
jgi:hypothetical protein